MRTDIDRLMAERDLDAMIIMGGEGENPHRAYLTNGAHASAIILKKRGDVAVMLVSPMEVEEAKKSGLEVLTYSDIKLHELYKEYKDDPDMRMLKMYERFFDRADFSSGRLGIYGSGDLGESWETLKLLDAHFPDIELVGERNNTIFDEAVATKDADEIAILRDVGVRTGAVMQAAWDFIAAHRAEGDTVIKADGSPLTVGDVKQLIKLKLLENGLEEGEHGTIFAIGRDGGFPHSRGEPEDVLKLGQAIVFDLFPRDVESGYFHDMTRTWSIGHATETVQRAYDHVMLSFNAVMDALAVGDKTQKYQLIALDVLEECGHPTSRSKPGTTAGYTHSLGHGLGMEVHENPRFSHVNDDDVLQVGNAFTIEPGLYYPDDGYGVRIEDTVVIDETGQAQTLTTMPKKLVLELTGG